MTDTINGTEIRRTVRETLDSDGPRQRSYLVALVESKTGIDARHVRVHLDRMEARGEVYLVGDRDAAGADPEVRKT